MAHVVEEHIPSFGSDYSNVAFDNAILVMGTDTTESLFLTLLGVGRDKRFARENTIVTVNVFYLTIATNSKFLEFDLRGKCTSPATIHYSLEKSIA